MVILYKYLLKDELLKSDYITFSRKPSQHSGILPKVIFLSPCWSVVPICSHSFTTIVVVFFVILTEIDLQGFSASFSKWLYCNLY